MKKKLIIRIAVLTLLFFVIAFLFPENIFSFNDKLWIYGAIVFFLLNTLYAMRKISSSLEVSQSKFNAIYFGSMGIKMLLALIFVIIYLKFSTLGNKFSVIFMLCIYFIYTGFEIQFILSKLRTNSEKYKNEDEARK
jgi:L-asparagine transporter-like permease